MFKSVLNVNKTRFFFFKINAVKFNHSKKKFSSSASSFFFGLIVYFFLSLMFDILFCSVLYFVFILSRFFFIVYIPFYELSSGFNFTSFFFFFSFCYHFHFVSNNFPCTRHFFLKLSIQCKVLSISIQHVQMQHKDLLNIFNILFITNCNNRNGLISTLDFTYFKLDVQINYQ